MFFENAIGFVLTSRRWLVLPNFDISDPKRIVTTSRIRGPITEEKCKSVREMQMNRERYVKEKKSAVINGCNSRFAKYDWRCVNPRVVLLSQYF